MLGGDDRRRFNRPDNKPGRFDETGRLPWMEAVEDDEPHAMGKGQKRFLLIIFALLALSLFASLLFYAYDRGRQEALSGGDTPIILAEDGPAKIQPADRGGLNVPDQDRLVFNSLNNQTESADQGGETFRNAPEQPLERPTSNAQDQTPATTQPLTDPTTNTENRTGQNVSEPVTSQPSLAITGNNPNADGGSMSNMPPGSYLIQLGAFGSNRSTEIAWGQLQDRYPFQLGRLDLEVEPLVRANSPTLYRLRAGPFTSRANADAACQSLRDSGQGCFVVSP